eukprot:952563-Pleurochrysis_carterae.AAC.2
MRKRVVASATSSACAALTSGRYGSQKRCVVATRTQAPLARCRSSNISTASSCMCSVSRSLPLWNTCTQLESTSACTRSGCHVERRTKHARPLADSRAA